MDDHDGGHDQSDDVGEVCGALENDGVGQLNRARVTLCWNARGAGDAGWRPNERAQWQCRLRAEARKVAESHPDCCFEGLAAGKCSIERAVQRRPVSRLRNTRERPAGSNMGLTNGRRTEKIDRQVRWICSAQNWRGVRCCEEKRQEGGCEVEVVWSDAKNARTSNKEGRNQDHHTQLLQLGQLVHSIERSFAVNHLPLFILVNSRCYIATELSTIRSPYRTERDLSKPTVTPSIMLLDQNVEYQLPLMVDMPP